MTQYSWPRFEWRAAKAIRHSLNESHLESTWITLWPRQSSNPFSYSVHTSRDSGIPACSNRPSYNEYLSTSLLDTRAKWQSAFTHTVTLCLGCENPGCGSTHPSPRFLILWFKTFFFLGCRTIKPASKLHPPSSFGVPLFIWVLTSSEYVWPVWRVGHVRV